MESKCGTFSQLVQVTEEDVMCIHIHVLSMSSNSEPCGWFADKENQELLALVYEIVLSKATAAESCAEKSDYQFKRSRNLRVLYKFKKVESRQHLVVPKHPGSFSGLIPQIAFVSNEGRKVLPFLNKRTQGSGYKSFRVLSNCMDMYVDSYPISDSRGIFKIRSKLNPGHHLCLDITSLFQAPSVLDPTIDGVCSLAEIPGAALKTRQVTRKGRDRGKGGKSDRKDSKGALKDKSNARSTSRDGGSTAGSIREFFKPRSPSEGHSDARLGPTLGVEPDLASVDLTEEEFCDFASQSDKCVPPKDNSVLKGQNPIPGCSFIRTSVESISESPPPPSNMLVSADPPSPPNQSGYVESCNSETSSEQERFPDLDMDMDADMQTDMQSAEMSGLSGLSNISTPEPEESYLTLPPNDSVASDSAETQSGVQDHDNSDSTCENGDEDTVLDEMDTASTTTTISDVIHIWSSGEESETGSSHSTSETRSAQKRKKLKSTKEIVKGASCVGDLTLKQLRQWVYFRKPLLVDIFKRIIFSQRHEDYYSSNKKRQALKYQLDTRMFREDQVELVTSSLLHIFCGNRMKYFSYVMSVLLPECMIRILADVNNITFAQAEKMIIN